MRQGCALHPVPVSELLQLARVQRERGLVDLHDLASCPQPRQTPQPTSTRKYEMHRQWGFSDESSEQSRRITSRCRKMSVVDHEADTKRPPAAQLSKQPRKR